jgi:rhodanese-related sulfurtransferase
MVEVLPMSSAPPPLEIDVQVVKAMLDAGEDLLLLDCREESEHATARIAGSTLLPMNQIPQRLGELEPHRERAIVVHCHHGGRSMRVTQWLRQQGFTNVRKLTGGIDAWSLAIDPSVPRY